MVFQTRRSYVLAALAAGAVVMTLFILWAVARDLAQMLLFLVVLPGTAVACAYLAGAARAHQEAIEAMTRQLAEREKMVALQRIAATVSSSLDLNEVLETVVSMTAQVMHCDKTAIFDLDQANARLNLIVAHGLSEAFQERCRLLPVGPTERGAAALGGPVMVMDIETDSRFRAYVPLARSEGFRSFIDVPMHSKGKVIGVLSAYFAEARTFSPSELDLLLTVANQAAMAVENARLYAQTDADLRRRVEELTTLQQVSLRLVSTLDLSTVLRTIADNTLRLVQANDVHIFLYDEATQILHSGIAMWANGETRPPISPRPNGITMTAIRERRPVVVHDTAKHPLYASSEASEWQVKSIASFPLLHGQSVIGVFNIAFLQAHTFTDDELRVLTLLSDQAAIAIDNARLHETLADQAKRDSLTQVYNHGYLVQSIEEQTKRAMARGTPLSFIMLDIDHFKQFNDRYGHATGDAVLRSVVRAISRHVKKTDTVGRWGGEEFGILLPGATQEQAEAVAQRIRRTLSSLELHDSDGQRIANPTISQGIATLPDHATTAEALIEYADRALYKAKSRGKDQICIAEHEGKT